MTQVKNFEDYIKKGIVKKQQPDVSRSNFLKQEANLSYISLHKRIKILGLENDFANSIIKDCYDIIMELIRADMLVEGFNASGHGAHEAEVAFFRNKGYSEKDVQFLNDLRYFRNGILYYGKVLDNEYARTVLDFLEKVKATK